jgi:hypothetical protein
MVRAVSNVRELVSVVSPGHHCHLRRHFHRYVLDTRNFVMRNYWELPYLCFIIPPRALLLCHKHVL